MLGSRPGPLTLSDGLLGVRRYGGSGIRVAGHSSLGNLGVRGGSVLRKLVVEVREVIHIVALVLLLVFHELVITWRVTSAIELLLVPHLLLLAGHVLTDSAWSVVR